MSPTDPIALGLLVALVFGLTAAMRKEWPKIDGRLVWLAAALLSLGLAIVSYPALLAMSAVRPILWLAAQTALGAIASDAGVARIGQHFAPKLSSAANDSPAPKDGAA